jgi:hypothetical protein
MVARTPVDFGPPDWLTLNAVFTRIREGWGSRDLAASELHQALLDGRLKSAAVLVRPTGERERHFLKPEFWRQFELAAALDGASVRCRPVKGMATTGAWYFFVRRSDLDALYPPDKPTQPVETESPRRRPGPPTKYDWHKIDGEIARRCIDPKTKQLKIPKRQSKLVKDVLEWCDQEFKDKTPGQSEMQEAVSRVCARFRLL